ncbi:MAG: calcium-translocating P-type ATPase, PMCA-type [Firmicutes bacterium]|nr:calcium-translocating P-type ATPase, PMCA-type [Bacillota bacterium]
MKDKIFMGTGLTTTQAEASARQHGTNALTKKPKDGFLKRYLASFGDPIIRILLVALGVNLLLMIRDANWYESAGIAVAVLLATLISTLSEYGSESAFEKLNEEAAHVKCRVRRDGKIVELPIEEIVVGDIVYIQAGERVPADGMLVAGEVDVDQSALNGETKEARKVAAKRSGNEMDLLSTSGLFRGSVACAGEGTMVVSRVGDSTFYGQLAIDVQESTIESPLKTRLTRLAKLISYFGYGAAAVVVAANLFNSIVLANGLDSTLIMAHLFNFHRLFGDVMMAVTLGITVIVMAVPEGLPMMITVVLSANMRRMLKDNVLVRKLVGIETSGSLNILFTDKTGTLTKGTLEVSTFTTPAGDVVTASNFKSLPLYNRVALSAFYNNSAQLVSKKLKTVAVGGNSTDRALLEYVKKDAAKLPLCQKGFVRPFNSRDKFSVAEVSGEETAIFLKGAPENLLPGCRYAYNDKGEKINFLHPTAIKETLTLQAKDGMRLLALCEAETVKDAEVRQNLTVVGFVGIRDEVRPEAKKAVADVLGAGVQVVMVTGDNRDTAVNVAAKLGLISAGDASGILVSQTLNQLNDEEVKRILPNLRVVARALPSDKGRLVRLAQEMGLVAGMTGDGVNDAPALKRADVGFAMGDGTEIAKEAGDIVILDNNFVSIVKAILYGRTIFKSIRKFLIFQLTINFCAVGVSLVGPFIGVPVPVTVIQMLWINMIMDTLAGLAYAGETPLAEYMKEAPKKRDEPIINGYMFNQILVTGLYTTLLSLAFFKIPYFFGAFRSDEGYFLTAFFALFIFAGVFNSLNARTYRLNILAYIEKNKMFIGIMLAVSVMQILLIYYGGAIFRTTGLGFGELALVITLASTVIFFDLGRKLVLRLYDKKGFI